ncbi:MAG: potassium transporter TrkG [Chloroflexota bacterium]|nr:potassium transporter TrkG [Chloroflexota bacterium]
MNATPPTGPSGRKEEEVRISRTHRIYRPMARAVRLARSAAATPKALGVTGVILGFAALIVVGAILLSLPEARQPGQEWNPLISIFTATSAVCVTGLVVVDTGTYWSPLGQGIILGLIQLGGLGVMTASMLILIILRRSISFRDKFELFETSKLGRIRSVGGLILVVVGVTLLIELLGAAALWFRLREYQVNGGLLWNSAFHAVSAFNNAGFDIMGGNRSLTQYAHDPVFLATVAVLVIAGGLGVLLLLDLVWKRSWTSLSLGTKIVLVTSGLLLAVGFLGILGAESRNPNTIESFSLPDKVSNAFFQAVTPRTAGFNSLPTNDLKDETQFLTMGLMFVGGATGSTAGGIKVNTFAVLALATLAAIRGYDRTTAYGRRFSHRIVYRALAIAALSLVALFVGSIMLMITDGFVFRRTLFETLSALGTVGLTTGITPTLSVAGKITIIVLMFVGRLGPLTLAYSLGRQPRDPSYAHVQEDIPLG